MASSLDILASAASVKSDGSTSVTLTVTALNAVRAALSGVSITMGADAGILGAATIITTDAGKATVSFSAGSGSLTANRTATITATAGSATAQIPIQIVAAGAATATAASLNISALPTTIKSDGSTTTTITVTALNASRAAVPGVPVTMSADTGILGAATVLTGDTGKATVTFSSGSGFINRTATVTATSEAISVQIPVQMVGSTVTLTSTGSSLPDNGTSPVTLTAVALDAGGNPVPKATINFTKTGAGNVTITPASGTTDVAGKFSALLAGVTGGVGPATVSAAALGAIATAAINVTPTATTFAIDQQRLNGNLIANDKVSAMRIGEKLEVRVNAPSAANVTFATTTGTWTYAGQGSQAPAEVVTVPVVAGKATATLSTTQASVATIQVYDPLIPGVSDLISVAMTSAIAASITLQATPSVVPRSVGTTTGSSTLIAMVRDSLGFPVGNAPVSFTIIKPTGGGETVTPAVVLTAATTTGGLNLGEARSSFTSGTLSSTAKGVLVRATVIGTSVATEATDVDVTPSGNDIAVVIGGTAGSVAFGQATVIKVGEDLSTYILPMSVLVADSNGNPAPLGTIVNLSAWPHAWSTGGACKIDADDGISRGTFLNEDQDENLILGLGEDAKRQYAAAPSLVIPGGKPDSLLTPTNSSGGTLPATLTTDVNGVAAFNLVYPKTSAIWTTTRIRARTVVQGSDAVGQIIFVLPALASDTTPLCILPPSPYVF